MSGQTKTITSASSRPMISSAALSSTEPRRAGAMRVALVTMILAGLASAATYLGSAWLAEQSTLQHLEDLRDAAQHDLTALVERSEREIAAVAEDAKTSGALASFKDGIRNATVNLADETPAELEAYQTRLTEFYESTIIPGARAAGRPTTMEALYPDDGSVETPNPTVVLQSLFVADALEGTPKPSEQTPASKYGDAHSRHAPWLRDMVRTLGWENLHLIDDTSGTVVFSATPSIATFTSLSDGVHRASSLSRASARSSGESQPGDVFFADAEFGLVDSAPRLFLSTPVFSGDRRVGTVVAAIHASTIDQALLPGEIAQRWRRADLGAAGQVLAFTGDGRVLSTPRQGAPVDPSSPGLNEALAGIPITGSFDGNDGAVLASYGPIDVGGRRWVIAAEKPRSEVVGPLLMLVPALLGIIALAALVGWMMGSRLWTQFAGKLRQISSVVQKAQRGDRKARLEGVQDGAVGELAAGINRLLEDRASVIERAEAEQEKLNRDAEQLFDIARTAAAGGSIEHAEIHAGALANVSSALNAMVDTIGALSESLQQASSQVGNSASQIRASADETSTNAAQQTRVCSETENSAKELLSEGGRIAEKCGEALDVARRTEQATRSGQAALTDLLTGMEGLQRETRAATVKIKRLGERSMQISAIIGSISKMSAQTDMLALNAAIEASRAGEQGQGFTLVADEVRKLAERAASAAKEIERLIGGIQSDIADAVGGMERQGERIEVQAAAASQAQHALEKVTVVTGEASTTMEEISNTADAQASAVERLGEAVSQIATTATGVQRASEQTRRSSAELSKLSEQLLARVEPQESAGPAESQ